MANITRLGARLRAARKAAGFKTSKEFLKKHKVPASTYSQHESGARNPDDHALKFYSKVFRVNFNWLKSGKGNPYTNNNINKNTIMKEELLDIQSIKKVEINQKILLKALTQSINI